MIPQEIIRHKRDGDVLHATEIQHFIQGLTRGTVSEGQAAAFAMAVFFNGMNENECVALTRAMTQSGAQIEWDLPGPALDKHSTGGIGDTVSLLLAPIVAACGGFVPMISGRGLGHTGGTLDKLDSIPGYQSQPDRTLFQTIVRDVGCAIIGQTDDLAPADRRLYAIRDVTATVESIPLITASILSKKLAAGLDGLVMDVKTGSGAFMSSLAQSRALATMIAQVANGAGLPTRALITDMDEPLASCAGNAIEVRHAIAHLKGDDYDARLHEVTMALAADLLLLGGLADNRDQARAQCERAWQSGAALEKLAAMVTGLGGPARLVEAPDQFLPRAPLVHSVKAQRDGFVHHIDTRALGLAVLTLGGGRTRTDDRIDPSVGLTGLARCGQKVKAGDDLALIHAARDNDALQAKDILQKAYRITDEKPEPRPLITAL